MDKQKRKLKLCIFLSDPLKVYYQKGEIKEGYYNPKGIFDEVHIVSFCDKDIDEEKVQEVAGRGKLFIHCLAQADFINIFSLLSLRNKIMDLIKNISPDAIRAYDASLRGALACYCAKKLHVISFVSIHTDYDEQRKYDKRPALKLRKFLERYVLANADIVICVSEHVKAYALRYRKGPIEIVYNSVDLGRFKKEKDKFTDSAVVNILCVGRLNAGKNQECLIKAIQHLDVKLTLVGDGNLYGYLTKMTRELNIEGKVNFVKSVPHREIHRYYQEADIFAISSRYEGFCIPLIEAMACALPIVASDIPAIREVVNGCGVLVENYPAAFRNEFQRLIRDVDFSRELGKKGMERARMFDLSDAEEKQGRIYEEAIKL